MKGGTDDDLAAMLTEIINSAADARDVRGLRLVATDLEETLRGLQADDEARLNEILVAKCGMKLFQRTDRIVARIMRRGFLKTDDEFRVLRAQLDDIELAKQFSESQVARINELLFT